MPEDKQIFLQSSEQSFIMFLGKSVMGFKSYDRNYKQTDNQTEIFTIDIDLKISFSVFFNFSIFQIFDF